jgi:hypothetical protein
MPASVPAGSRHAAEDQDDDEHDDEHDDTGDDIRTTNDDTGAPK